MTLSVPQPVDVKPPPQLVHMVHPGERVVRAEHVVLHLADLVQRVQRVKQVQHARGVVVTFVHVELLRDLFGVV